MSNVYCETWGELDIEVPNCTKGQDASLDAAMLLVRRSDEPTGKLGTDRIRRSCHSGEALSGLCTTIKANRLVTNLTADTQIQWEGLVAIVSLLSKY